MKMKAPSEMMEKLRCTASSFSQQQPGISPTGTGSSWWERMRTLYTKFKRKAFVIISAQEQMDKSASGADMHKVLGPFSLVMLGIGCIIGAGVFVLTGVAARKYAGPGVILSYGMSALASLFAALCYAEYATELPVAGGAFNFVSMTFGEFAAWVCACDLVLEYTLSAAAVAKGCTAYTAALLDVPLHDLALQVGMFTLDPLALLFVVLLSLILMRSTADSSLFNNIVTGTNVAVIVLVIAAGLPHADPSNYQPFLPFGLRGAFTGASVVFFSFIGFDTVSTAAEEVKNPARDLPIGIVGSLAICTVFYMLMCVTITGMQNYTTLDMNAPFAVAFAEIGMGWAQRLIALGALTGIVTSLLGSLLGQARIYVTLGRQHLLPPWIARVHEESGTPRNAAKVTMFTAGTLALFFDIEMLAELVSIGTLIVFAMVCGGVLFRRYYVWGQGEPISPVLLRLAGIVLCSVAASMSFIGEAHVAVPILFVVLWLAATASFLLLPVRYMPSKFAVPLCPFMPSCGVLACLHLIGSLGWPAYVRWIVWFLLGTTVYLCYGLHHSQGEAESLCRLGSGLDSRQMSSSGPIQVGDVELRPASSANELFHRCSGTGTGTTLHPAGTSNRSGWAMLLQPTMAAQEETRSMAAPLMGPPDTPRTHDPPRNDSTYSPYAAIAAHGLRSPFGYGLRPAGYYSPSSSPRW